MLNSEQEKAISHPPGPLAVFAGPGSGKTTVITLRASHLAKAGLIDAKGLYLITFTRASALEMKERLRRIGEEQPRLNQAAVCTFHSLFLKILLRYYGHIPSILSESDQRKIIEKIFPKSPSREPGHSDASEFLSEMTRCKNNLILPEQLISKETGLSAFSKRFAAYEEYKRELMAWDYDDILIQCFQLLHQNRNILHQVRNQIDYLMVDEFQDTNFAQYEILKLLTPSGNLTVVGDDDQSIYGFRGSSSNYLLKFQRDYPLAQQVVLNRNYRSTDSLIEFSQSVIACNLNRQLKSISGIGLPGGAPVMLEALDERNEAEQVVQLVQRHSGLSIGILYRTHLQSQFIEDELAFRDFPYQLERKTDSYFEKWQVKDVLEYLEFHATDHRSKKRLLMAQFVKRLPFLRDKWQELALVNASDSDPAAAIERFMRDFGYLDYLHRCAKRLDISFEQVYEPVGILYERSKKHVSISCFLELIRSRAYPSKDQHSNASSTKMTTFHGAKGLEFDVVILIGCNKGLVPYIRPPQTQLTAEQLEEERRLFYVAITRAKRYLYLLTLSTRCGRSVHPSPFLNGISPVVRYQ